MLRRGDLLPLLQGGQRLPAGLRGEVDYMMRAPVCCTAAAGFLRGRGACAR